MVVLVLEFAKPCATVVPESAASEPVIAEAVGGLGLVGSSAVARALGSISASAV